MAQFLTSFLYLLIIIGIIFAAYITSKFLAVKSQQMSQGKYLKVTDRIVLGKDKSIVIISVGEKNYLMSENAQGFNVICSLSESDLELNENNTKDRSFKDFINLYLKNNINEKKADENIHENIHENNKNKKDYPVDILSQLKTKASDTLNHIVNKQEKDGKDK